MMLKGMANKFSVAMRMVCVLMGRMMVVNDRGDRGGIDAAPTRRRRDRHGERHRDGHDQS